MKKIKLIFTLSLVLAFNYTLAQLCTPDNRYTNSEYFTSTQIDSLKNVTYGTAVNYLGEEQALKMDFYFPKDDVDSLAKATIHFTYTWWWFYGRTKRKFYNSLQ